MMNIFGPFTSGKGRFQVAAQGYFAGGDIIASVTGGEKPHAGAVALAIFSSTNSEKVSVQTLKAPDHKDDIPARALAFRLALALETNVCLTVGLHVNHASPKDIDTLLHHADAAASQLEAALATQMRQKLTA